MTTETQIPTATRDGLTFFPIPEFDGPSVAFGADLKHYFNRRELPKVPREYSEYVSNLFFNGGELPDFDPRVDRKKARYAVNALLRSFAPAHEQKEATVAYAFWVWSTPASIDAATGAAP